MTLCILKDLFFFLFGLQLSSQRGANVTKEPSGLGPSSLTPCSRKKPSDLSDPICSFGPERSRPRGNWAEHSLVCEYKPYLKSFQFHVSVSWGLLFFGGLGIKPVALNFVSKCSTTKLSPQPLIMPPARNWIQKAGPLPSDFSVTFTKPIFFNWSARENEICWTIFIC